MIVVETANIVLRQRGGDREGRRGRDTVPANVERNRIIAPWRWQDRPTSDPRKAVLASKEASSRRRYKAIAPCML